MRTKYYNTGKYKKSKYMNFKYQQVYLKSDEDKESIPNSDSYYNTPKFRRRRWYILNSFERHEEMLKYIKELVKK